MVPTRIFDTERAGRLAGFPRVGLGAMVEELLGLRLEKGYSAADWSTRPLPAEWLVYAALDVEVLVELRDLIEEELVDQNKLEWARQDFAQILAAPPAPPRVDPWRRTAGVHKLKDRRQLAAVRSMWEARDALARSRDIAPGRVLPDRALVEAVRLDPTTEKDLMAVPVFGGRSTRRQVGTWLAALRAGADSPEETWPRSSLPGDGPPAPARWADRDPVAAARLARVRTAMAALSEKVGTPVENLLQPDALRRVLWSPPEEATVEAVSAALAGLGARRWQCDLVAPIVVDALTAPLPEPRPAEDDTI